MMVGSVGLGKFFVWRLFLDVLQQVENVEGVFYVIDSKVMFKEVLYGNFDLIIREWIDGLFMSILCKIVDNLCGEDIKCYWILFDGDVDFEWVENLNSVFDDNKFFMLFNGECFNLLFNVCIMFEVENFKYVIFVIVSCCGMVWFSEDIVILNMLVINYIEMLWFVVFEDLDEDVVVIGQSLVKVFVVQVQVVGLLQVYFMIDNFINEVLQ